MRGFNSSTIWKVVLFLLTTTAVVGSGVYHWQNAPLAYAATDTVNSCDAATLQNVVNGAAAGDTINFGCTGTIVMTGTLNITKDLTLDGSGKTVTLSGNNAYRIISVTNSVNFTLNDLTLTKGYSDMGGVINNSGTLTVTNSSFISNTSPTNGSGAAIYSVNATINLISNTSFISNSIVANGGGGAIYNGGGTFRSIVNSSFVGNSDGLYGSGGAIFSYGANTTISNTSFINNSVGANGLGGAINSNDANNFTIFNSTFSGNSAPDGGAIFVGVNGAAASVTNSVFANSTSGGNCSGTVTDGGYNLSDDGTCGFSATGSQNSVASLNLGTLGYYGGSTETIPLLYGSAAIGAAKANCPTTDQRGMSRQGAPSSCDVGAFQTGIIGNSTSPSSSLCSEGALNGAMAGAGDILIYCPANTTITVTASPDTSSNFRQITSTVALDASPSTNFAISGNNSYKLFFVGNGATLSLNNLTITKGSNEAITTFGVMTATNSIFNNNNVAIGSYGTTLSVLNSTFSYNTGTAGAAISGYGNIAIISNTIFTNNSASYGAAINQASPGTITEIINTTFNNNSASEYGGALNSNGTINNIVSSTFYSNTSPDGGAINNATTIGTISNTNFISNTSSTDGGAIDNSEGTISNLANSSFISNTASTSGGAVYFATKINFTDDSFEANTAKNGGAIENANGTLAITGTTFISNTASSNGGAVDNSGGNGMSLLDSIFTGNSAATGGAVYNGGSNTAIITGTTFLTNTATDGGAIANYGTISGITNSTFSGNKANDSGAVILDEGTINNIADSTFANNSSNNYGGVISAGGNSETIINSTFSGNSSAQGGVLNTDGADIAITNSTFSGNSATSTGSTFFNGGTLVITNSIIAHSGTNGNCSGSTITDGGYNLSDDSSCSLSGTSQNSVSNLNLGTLGNYGGSTETIPLLAGSKAIGFVASGCPATDQRGYTRPATNCAAGAYEVDNSTISLTSSPNPSTYGQPVTFTATLSPTSATGTVTFTIGSTSVTSTVSSGAAIYVTSTLPVGSTVITATYSGDFSYTASTSNTVTQTVSKATPSVGLVSSATVITQGQSVSFTATVSSSSGGTPSGTVTFYDGSTALGSAVSLSNGVATYSTASLAVGSHSITASYSGDSNFNSASSNTVTVTVNSSNNGGGGGNTTSYTYYLPFVANNASNFTTYLAFQNIGSASANITVTYYDNNGNALTSSTLITQVVQYAEALPTNPFANGKQGTGIITSDQPLNVIVPEATPYGGSAYAVSSGSSNSLIAPFALNNAFGDFTTQLNIFNGGASAVTATVTFYGTVGNSTTITSTSTNVAIQPHTTANLNQNTLPSGFSGWAQISGSANTLVAQVLEQSPSTKFVAIANAVASPSSSEYAPAVFAGGYGGFYTGANIINPNASAVTVTVTYYDLSANALPTTPFMIAAHGVASIFNGSSGGNGIPNGGLPKNFIGSMAVSAVGGNIAMSVNENGGVTSAGNSRSGTYAAIANGSSTVGLPVVSNGGFTYVTGDTILNTSSQTVSATINYYDVNGKVVSGASKSFTIAGHGSQAYYQGDGSLPSNFYGTAVITETGGAANSLIVTTNAQNIALFYTYSEPNS